MLIEPGWFGVFRWDDQARGRSLSLPVAVLPGRPADAARRELKEETGLLALTLTLGDVADGILKDGAGAVTAHYTIIVFAARDVEGVLAAASDAAAAAFFGPEERMRLQRTPGLDQAIENAKRALERASQ